MGRGKDNTEQVEIECITRVRVKLEDLLLYSVMFLPGDSQ